MQMLRTIVWMLISAMLVAFIAMNWTSVPVNLWPLDTGFLHFDWPVGVVALVFFLLGLLPMWLLAQAGHWRIKRRIASLENAVRASTPAKPAPTAPITTPAPLDPDDPELQS